MVGEWALFLTFLVAVGVVALTLTIVIWAYRARNEHARAPNVEPRTRQADREPPQETPRRGARAA
jgi:heme/copper-type cytochrome/quinol oxidase subunit 2